MPVHHGSNHPPGGNNHRQISLWADLLTDLDRGAPSISTSASEMAEDVPRQLRSAVNNELARRGCPFRISA
ncbi:MAG: hypothetical protein RLZZ336_2094 [Cyanobacteriota bacterium]